MARRFSLDSHPHHNNNNNNNNGNNGKRRLLIQQQPHEDNPQQQHNQIKRILIAKNSSQGQSSSLQKKMLNLLHKANYDYLKEKASLGREGRPNLHKLDLLKPLPATTYNHSYHPINNNNATNNKNNINQVINPYHHHSCSSLPHIPRRLQALTQYKLHHNKGILHKEGEQDRVNAVQTIKKLQKEHQNIISSVSNNNSNKTSYQLQFAGARIAPPQLLKKDQQTRQVYGQTLRSTTTYKQSYNQAHHTTTNSNSNSISSRSSSSRLGPFPSPYHTNKLISTSKKSSLSPFEKLNAVGQQQQQQHHYWKATPIKQKDSLMSLSQVNDDRQFITESSVVGGGKKNISNSNRKNGQVVKGFKVIYEQGLGKINSEDQQSIQEEEVNQQAALIKENNTGKPGIEKEENQSNESSSQQSSLSQSSSSAIKQKLIKLQEQNRLKNQQNANLKNNPFNKLISVKKNEQISLHQRQKPLKK